MTAVLRWILTAGAVSAALVLVACGSDDRRPLTAMESARMVRTLDDIRERTRQGDAAGARDALRQLRARVDALARDGALTASARRPLDAGISRLSRALDGRPATDTSRTASSSPRRRADVRSSERVTPRRSRRNREAAAETPAADHDEGEAGERREQHDDEAEEESNGDE